MPKIPELNVTFYFFSASYEEKYNVQHLDNLYNKLLYIRYNIIIYIISWGARGEHFEYLLRLQ